MGVVDDFCLRYSKCDNLVRNKMHFENVVLVRNLFPNCIATVLSALSPLQK